MSNTIVKVLKSYEKNYCYGNYYRPGGLHTPGRIDPLDRTRAYTFSYAHVLSRRSILPVVRSLLRLIWSSESRRLLGAAANYRRPSTTVQDPLDFFKLRRTVRIPSYMDEKLHPIIVMTSLLLGGFHL
ncbi:hypothetical protein SK128_028655 [Halocaridina rubra]|uniref:Uncharacterized protein n=1 Tax=Halocaridina rubra TaxID=373956 RepID=A0AAN8X105_HALRR